MSRSLHPSAHQALANARQKLLATFNPAGCWEGRLASSALSTAVAVLALGTIDRQHHARLVDLGCQWLADHLNPGGGWGDTPASPANLSTTLLAWAAFSQAVPGRFAPVIQKTEDWLRQRLGGLDAATIAAAVLRFYGQDRTFSAPILTVCALAGRLGEGGQAWARVPQLPFELALLPGALFRWLRLSVVSYAIPALIAIGLVRHHHARRRWSILGWLRERQRRRVLGILRRMQPASGGFLEATPLTAFVALGLAAAGHAGHPAARDGVRFLEASVRPDGSWPIDTNLATWVTTLAINNLDAEVDQTLSSTQRQAVLQWLLGQQHQRPHPFTRAAPGGWAWTDLSGGVPDADDTSGALLALKKLGAPAGTQRAAEAGIRWLLALQNRDGGLPTFCRGWGKLPFDRSCPDLTAHALRAWVAWREEAGAGLQRRIGAALGRGLDYLAKSQTSEGAWVPLWFGNQAAPGHLNPVYGTAQVVLALGALDPAEFTTLPPLIDRGCQWLESAQNQDGGWGGSQGVPASVEETALATRALALAGPRYAQAAERGLAWLLERTRLGTVLPPAPIGLYFASLWYHEEAYPLVFLVGALTAFAQRPCGPGHGPGGEPEKITRL
jgi:squalene-hopene/tetraprenyl-beta-curcumene cyclase